MIEIGICLLMIILLLTLFAIFGKTAVRVFGLGMGKVSTLLLGVFVYFGLFQMAALPLIMLKQPLSLLTGIWMVIVTAVVVFFAVRERKNIGLRQPMKSLMSWFTVIKVLMIFLVVFQFYYMITREYLGWDTTAYIGTVGTSVIRNSMYQYNGETGRAVSTIPFRYALSGFYMHSAVWCQLLGIRALYFAKIVQGGLICVLSNLAVFQLGSFLFSGKQYGKIIPQKRLGDFSAAMVSAAIILNFFFDTIYSASDFLLSRGLEAKAYCANLVLPCILLFSLMIWRNSSSREAKVCLFAAAFSSVAISMSCLVIVPAMVTILMLPVLLKEKNWKTVRFYLLCILPNGAYMAVYLLSKMNIIRIGV